MYSGLKYRLFVLVFFLIGPVNFTLAFGTHNDSVINTDRQFCTTLLGTDSLFFLYGM